MRCVSLEFSFVSSEPPVPRGPPVFRGPPVSRRPLAQDGGLLLLLESVIAFYALENRWCTLLSGGLPRPALPLVKRGNAIRDSNFCNQPRVFSLIRGSVPAGFAFRAFVLAGGPFGAGAGVF